MVYPLICSFCTFLCKEVLNIFGKMVCEPSFDFFMASMNWVMGDFYLSPFSLLMLIEFSFLG